LKATSILTAGCVMVLLAGCGTDSRERVQGGAATGAATGAAIGVVGGPVGVVVGGVVGGGVGAITGATTESKDLNLGRPVWANPETRIPTPSGPVAPANR